MSPREAHARAEVRRELREAKLLRKAALRQARRDRKSNRREVPLEKGSP